MNGKQKWERAITRPLLRARVASHLALKPRAFFSSAGKPLSGVPGSSIIEDPVDSGKMRRILQRIVLKQHICAQLVALDYHRFYLNRRVTQALQVLSICSMQKFWTYFFSSQKKNYIHILNKSFFPCEDLSTMQWKVIIRVGISYLILYLILCFRWNVLHP